MVLCFFDLRTAFFEWLTKKILNFGPQHIAYS